MPAFPSYRFLIPALSALMLGSGPTFGADNPLVVTSLKPLELLVRAVAHDQVAVTTLVPAGSSPHTYQLRPSQRQDLEDAERVFWVGPDMETFLTRLLSGPDLRDRAVALAPDDSDHAHGEANHHGHDDQGHRDHDNHDHDGHQHASEEDHHDHGHSHAEGEDPHVWLDPALALAMAKTIAVSLKEINGVDPQAIDENLESFAQDLKQREDTIRQQLTAARGLDLFTYHDAFGRFAEHYGLEITGVLALSPERSPGARHLAEVQERLRDADQACLMIEPQFDRQWWQSLMGDVELPISVWDPLATDIPATPDGYLAFQQSMADAVSGCLPEHAQQ